MANEHMKNMFEIMLKSYKQDKRRRKCHKRGDIPALSSIFSLMKEEMKACRQRKKHNEAQHGDH